MSFIENLSMCIYILYPIRLAIAHERLWLRGGLGGKDEYLVINLVNNLVNHQIRRFNDFFVFLSATFRDKFVIQFADKLVESWNSVINWVIKFVTLYFNDKFGESPNKVKTIFGNFVLHEWWCCLTPFAPASLSTFRFVQNCHEILTQLLITLYSL